MVLILKDNSPRVVRSKQKPLPDQITYFTLLPAVLKLDDNSYHGAQACRKIALFEEKKIGL